MKKRHFYVLTFSFALLCISYAQITWAKADCELKQLVTADEFKIFQEKWKPTSPLPIVEKDYLGLKSNEIYFYDTKSLLFKEKAILRWRKKDGDQGSFTIKDRFVSVVQKSAECQLDYTGNAIKTNSCQLDHDSLGPLPGQIQLSEDQKLFLSANNLEWKSNEIIALGPIYSYETEIATPVCKDLNIEKPIELGSWLMKDDKHSQMFFEISMKVKKDGKPKKCDDVDIAFRDCLKTSGVNIDSNRGTKTKAVYIFFGY